MIGRSVYLDSSAFVKLVLAEAESAALVAFLGQAERLASSALLLAEARRAALRIGERYVERVEMLLPTVHVHAVDQSVLVAAGRLMPTGLRTLDAIHLATALALRSELDCVVTYDERMAEAATLLGFRVAAPR